MTSKLLSECIIDVNITNSVACLETFCSHRSSILKGFACFRNVI